MRTVFAALALFAMMWSTLAIQFGTPQFVGSKGYQVDRHIMVVKDFDTLHDAIVNGTMTAIDIQADIVVTTTLHIPKGRPIELMSTNGAKLLGGTSGARAVRRRIITVGGILVIRDLTLQWGYSQDRDGLIQDCQGRGQPGGGAIAVGSSGSVAAFGVTFKSNDAFVYEYYGDAYGGAVSIASGGVFSGVACVFFHNRAHSWLWKAHGGAVFVQHDAKFTCSACQFDKNRVEAANTGGVGGAIYADGAVTLRNTRFVNNHAGHYGGALFVSKTGQASFTNLYFGQNEADGGNGTAVHMGTGDTVCSVMCGTCPAGQGLKQATCKGQLLEKQSTPMTDKECSNCHGVPNCADFKRNDYFYTATPAFRTTGTEATTLKPLPVPTPAPTWSSFPSGALSHPWAMTAQVSGPRVFDYFPLGALVDLLVCENITLRARAKRSGVPGDNQQWFDLVSVSVHNNEVAKIVVKYKMTVDSRKWFDLGEGQGWFDIMKSDALADPATQSKAMRKATILSDIGKLPPGKKRILEAALQAGADRNTLLALINKTGEISNTTERGELTSIGIYTAPHITGTDINKSPDWRMKTNDGVSVSITQNTSHPVGNQMQETVDIKYQGTHIKVSSAAVTSSDAHYGAKPDQQPHPDLHKTHTHLDILFPAFPATIQKTCTSGVLAEIWGLAPMSATTTAMLSMGMQ